MTTTETQTEETIETVTPEIITQEILDAAAAHAAATQQFIEHFEFYGKSLDAWSDQLAVPVPPQVTPETMRNLFIKLANNTQVASHFYSVANTINSTFVGGGQIKKSDLVAAIVRQYESSNRTRPAGTVIERMADSYMKSTAGSKTASKIVKQFWRDRLDALAEVRKCLEQIQWSMNSELKYLGSGEQDGKEYTS